MIVVGAGIPVEAGNPCRRLMVAALQAQTLILGAFVIVIAESSVINESIAVVVQAVACFRRGRLSIAVR